MRCATLVLVLVLAGVAAQAQPTPVPGIPIEGVLVEFEGWYMEGTSENWSWLPPGVVLADVSPDSSYFVYWGHVGWPVTEGDILRCNPDGSDVISLTPGLGGTNCLPRCSPDGTKVVFQHSSIGEWVPDGPKPCWAWEVYVADAQGDPDPRPVVGLDQGGGNNASFAPNGYRLVYDGAEGTNLIDVDGTDKRTIIGPGCPLENGSGAAWSRDGLALAVEHWEGSWHQIVVVDQEGNDPRVVFERLMPDDVLDENMHYWAGPARPCWSPLGDRIAFVGMGILGDEGHDLYLPWHEPPGPPWNYNLLGALQTELYLVDADGASPPIRLTADEFSERGCNWNGPNTFPEDPEVTVDNTTVTFSGISEGGLTTIIRDDDPPALPGGYQFCGEFYDVNTSATYTGPITIAMTYKHEDIAGGVANEPSLLLLHYNEASGQWDDITTSLDTDANIIQGQVDSLSPVGIGVKPTFGGFRQPINVDGSSVFKAGRTIPIKFVLTDALGNSITDATARLSYWQVSPDIVGTVPEGSEPVWPDTGCTFRYDPEGQQYIYNLSTKGLGRGTWLLRVTADGWPAFEATVLVGWK